VWQRRFTARMKPCRPAVLRAQQDARHIALLDQPPGECDPLLVSLRFGKIDMRDGAHRRDRERFLLLGGELVRRPLPLEPRLTDSPPGKPHARLPWRGGGTPRGVMLLVSFETPPDDALESARDFVGKRSRHFLPMIREYPDRV